MTIKYVTDSIAEHELLVDLSVLRDELLKLPHVTAISHEDYNLYRHFFQNDPFNSLYPAIYANSWLYVTQAARGFGMGLKYCYGDLLVTIGVKLRYDGINLVVIRPVDLAGDQGDELLGLLDQLYRLSQRPVFLKKIFPEQWDILKTQIDFISAVEYDNVGEPMPGTYPWDTEGFADDDTFPEMIYNLDLSLAFELSDDEISSVSELGNAEKTLLTYKRHERYHNALRNKLNKFERQANNPHAQFHLKPYTLNDIEVVTEFLANYFSYERESNLQAYRNMLSSPFVSNCEQCFAYVAYSDVMEKPVAFFCAERLAGQAAGLYSGVVMRSHLGLSEYLHIVMMQTLKKEGIQLLNRGGSENKGLYTYKRKFAPVEERRMYMAVYGEQP